VSYLLDTDICSAYLKGNRDVWQKVTQYGGQLHVSVISVGELFAWVLRPTVALARQRAVIDFLNDVTLLDVNWDVAHKFGEIRATQYVQGQLTPEMDLLIAATSLVHQLTLVTHFVLDFVNVPGLVIDDWLKP
jgi:tRNA(fMet)-specific endonuclease VapC